MPVLVPESPERRCEPHDTVDLAGVLEPAHGSAQVVVVALQWIEPLLAAPDPDQMRLRLLGEGQEVLGVAPPPCFGSGRLLEPLGCVLADRLEHPEPVALADANEALVDERLERVEVCVADLLRRLERPAAGEHGEAREQRLLAAV